MRLDQRETAAIRAVIRALDAKAIIYLHGSRVNDALRGGDIDLIVFSQTLTFSDKISILVNLKEQLGDQRIDITLKRDPRKIDDPFIALALREALKL